MLRIVNTHVTDLAGSTRARFTVAQFARMVEADVFEDEKVELIDGNIEQMQKPKNLHAAHQAQVVIGLATVADRQLVRGEAGIDLGDDTVVAADAVPLNAPISESRWFTAADLHLVIEIAETTLDRDLGMKRHKYASVGIPNYWVVDGGRSVVHVFSEPRDGDFSHLSLVRFGEPLEVPGTKGTITLD